MSYCAVASGRGEDSPYFLSVENLSRDTGKHPRRIRTEAREREWETLLRQLHKYLLHAVAGEQVLLVIIDEAQSLSKELIGELGKLCGQERRLQIVFVGQSELEGKLDSRGLSQIRQKTEIRYRIRALSWKGSQEYIDHRLRLVGSSSSEVFTPMALPMIVGYARGIPRVINILCDNALFKGCQSFTKKVGVRIVCEAINVMEGPLPAKSILSIIIRIIRKCRPVAVGVDLSWPRRYLSFS